MNSDLARFLEGHAALVEESAVWDNGRLPLRIHSYLSDQLPPLEIISSARSVLFRDDAVLVVRGPWRFYILPGGRSDPGETPLQTLRREMLEETGWTLAHETLLGFKHFRHLAPKPPDYPYPYPDFIQVIYAAEAVDFVAEARQADEYVLETTFHPIAEAQALDLAPNERLFLDAALRNRSKQKSTALGTVY